MLHPGTRRQNDSGAHTSGTQLTRVIFYRNGDCAQFEYGTVESRAFSKFSQWCFIYFDVNDFRIPDERPVVISLCPLCLQKKVDVRDAYLYVIPLLFVILAMVVCGIGIYDWVGPRELNSFSGYVVFGLWWLIKIVPVVFIISIFLLLKNGNASSASDDVEYAGELAFSKVVFYCFGAHWFLLLLAYFSGFFMSQQTNVALGVAGNYLMFILLKVIFVVGVIAVLQAVKVVKKNERNKISDHLAKIEKIED